MSARFPTGRKREYYEVLGVPTDANEEMVKRAYRKLALELHPDRPHNKGKENEADSKFKKVQEAYEKLKSGRTTLDMLKTHFKSEDIHSSLEHFFFTTNSQGTLNTLDITSLSEKTTFTSSGSKINLNLRKGQSLKTTLQVTWKESLYGCTKTIEYTKSTICPDCKNSDSHRVDNCRECKGRGVLSAFIGGANLSTPCTYCHHNGAPKTVCTTCNGIRRLPKKTTCVVEVPPGVITGTSKVFEGHGDDAEDDSAAGDFIVLFQVEPHNFFSRKGDDAHCSLFLSFPHLLLGVTMELPSIYGESLRVQIEPSLKPLQTIRIPNEGFLNPDTQVRGDMFVAVQLEHPKQINEEERTLLKQLSNLPNFQSRLPCTFTSSS